MNLTRIVFLVLITILSVDSVSAQDAKLQRSLDNTFRQYYTAISNGDTATIYRMTSSYRNREIANNSLAEGTIMTPELFRQSMVLFPPLSSWKLLRMIRKQLNAGLIYHIKSREEGKTEFGFIKFVLEGSDWKIEGISVKSDLGKKVITDKNVSDKTFDNVPFTGELMTLSPLLTPGDTAMLVRRSIAMVTGADSIIIRLKINGVEVLESNIAGTVSKGVPYSARLKYGTNTATITVQRADSTQTSQPEIRVFTVNEKSQLIDLFEWKVPQDFIGVKEMEFSVDR